MLLRAENLKFTHPGQATLSFPAIELDSQESLVILGRSGSGKTTLAEAMLFEGGVIKIGKRQISIT